MKKSLLLSLTIFILLSNTLVYAKVGVTNLVNPVSYFVNHVAQLNELEQNLNNYKKSSIVGTSGIGKTQLARMYAYEKKDNYDLIWFIDCNFDLKQEFLKLAKAINISANNQIISENLTTIEEEMISYLSTFENWLLVFDNNKTQTNIKLKKFIELEHNGHMLFCSQDLKGLPYIIKVKGFSKTDSALLAKVILKDDASKEVNFLVEAFKGYPVLVVQGAQILSNIRGLNNVKYKKMIQETDNKIKLNIELCMKELTPSASELLRKIALINNQSFSKSFLNMITNDQESLDDDIYQLSRFVLISNTIYDESDPLFEMHDVIADAIQSINTKEQNKKYLEEMTSRVLEKSFPKGVAKRHTIRTSPTIGENLQIILSNAEKFDAEILKILELRLELFGTSTNNGDYEASKAMVEWFEEKDKNKAFNLSEMTNHEKYVYALYIDIIGCYSNYALSDPIKASEYFIQAKEIASTVKGYEYMKFNIVYQLFRVLLDLGRLGEAEETMRELSEIYKKGLENNTIEQGEACYLYVGNTRLFLAQEKYDKALEQINLGIDTLKQSGLKETDMFLESSYQLKIEALNGLQEYQEAYLLAEWLYKIYEPHLSPDHEILGNIRTKMSIALYGQNKIQEGLGDANKAIEIFIKTRNFDPKKLQFAKDIQLAKALMIKADCLSALDRIEESLSTYEIAEAIYNNVYIGHLNSSAGLRHILFEATKTACKKPSKSNEFWFKHFYSQLRSVFGLDIPEVKEVEQVCKTEFF